MLPFSWERERETKAEMEEEDTEVFSSLLSPLQWLATIANHNTWGRERERETKAEMEEEDTEVFSSLLSPLQWLATIANHNAWGRERERERWLALRGSKIWYTYLDLHRISHYHFHFKPSDIFWFYLPSYIYFKPSHQIRAWQPKVKVVVPFLLSHYLRSVSIYFP